jgi:hypothetical protein
MTRTLPSVDADEPATAAASLARQPNQPRAAKDARARPTADLLLLRGLVNPLYRLRGRCPHPLDQERSQHAD